MGNKIRARRWEIDRTSATIRRKGLLSKAQRIDARLFRVLELLVDKAGEPVSQEEILKVAWEGRVVSPDSVSTAIYQLRKILGEDAKNPSNLFTVPHRGYMWRGSDAATDGLQLRGGFLPAWSYALLAGFCLALVLLGPRGQQHADTDHEVESTGDIFLAPVVNSTGDQELDVSSDAVDATFVNALLRLNPDLATTRNSRVASRFTLHSEVVYCDSRPTLVLTLIDSEQDLYLWSEYYDFYGDFEEPSMVEHAAKRVTQVISRI